MDDEDNLIKLYSLFYFIFLYVEIMNLQVEVDEYGVEEMNVALKMNNVVDGVEQNKFVNEFSLLFQS